MSSSPAPDTDDAEAPPAPKKWSGKRIVMIAGPVLLLLVGGGVGASFLLGGEKEGGHEEAGAHGEASSGEHGEKGGKEGDDVLSYVDLPPMLVNLKAPDRKTSFLKLAVALEVKGAENAAQVQERMPRVIDGFQVYLRELRTDDLAGSAGMFRLKEELLRRVNTALAPLQVQDVLFKEMLVQ